MGTIRRLLASPPAASCRILRLIRHRPSVVVSGTTPGTPRGFSIVVSGTASTALRPVGGSWYQEPAASWFQEPQLSWFWEPALSWFQEPRRAWFQEPGFVVSGTRARGNRNPARRIHQQTQWSRRISTALNGLTSLSNRVSFNAAQVKKTSQHAASWGLRPRRLAPPLRGSAPGANAPSHPASPNRHRASPDNFSLEETPTQKRPIPSDETAATVAKGLSEESLAFSARDPGNRKWAASAPKRGGLAQ